jgi:hypothetical protein
MSEWMCVCVSTHKIHNGTEEERTYVVEEAREGEDENDGADGADSRETDVVPQLVFGPNLK